MAPHRGGTSRRHVAGPVEFRVTSTELSQGGVHAHRPSKTEQCGGLGRAPGKASPNLCVADVGQSTRPSAKSSVPRSCDHSPSWTRARHSRRTPAFSTPLPALVGAVTNNAFAHRTGLNGRAKLGHARENRCAAGAHDHHVPTSAATGERCAATQPCALREWARKQRNPSSPGHFRKTTRALLTEQSAKVQRRSPTVQMINILVSAEFAHPEAGRSTPSPGLHEILLDLSIRKPDLCGYTAPISHEGPHFPQLDGTIACNPS